LLGCGAHLSGGLLRCGGLAHLRGGLAHLRGGLLRCGGLNLGLDALCLALTILRATLTGGKIDTLVVGVASVVKGQLSQRLKVGPKWLLPVIVSIEDTTPKLGGVAAIVVTVVGLTLNDFWTAAIAVWIEATITRSLFLCPSS